MAGVSGESASRGAIGGASGDAGVEYRRAVAAYTVAYGLADLPLSGFGFSGRHAMVAKVSLETDDAVDDIRIDYVGGASSFVQAKRRLTGGPEFASAVGQWRRAAEMGLDVDRHRLVIVAGTLSGPMLNLQRLLHRYSGDTVGGLTGAEKRILARLDAHLGNLLPEQRAALLKCASILDLDVEEPLGTHARQATGLLAGSVCVAEDAELAWSTLVSTAGQLARRRAGYDLSSWLGELRAASVRLSTSGDTRCARLERMHRAVERYESELRSAANWLDLQSLGASAAPIAMEVADAEIEVHLNPDDSHKKGELMWVALRRGRVVLTGLPGGGKSTAMATAAAQLVGVPRAPLPVLASLKDMYGHGRHGSFHQRLLAAAAGRVRNHERDLLSTAIEERLDDGRIMLFLDGLDETYEHRAEVVSDLHLFLRGVHEDVGVVLATRDVAYGQAATLGWSAIRLARPGKMGTTIQAVLRAAAQALSTTAGPALSAEEWIGERTTWITKVLTDDTTLAETPLLPLLLTLLAIERDTAALPTRRARILLEVVTAAVDRHERRRREKFSFGILEGTDAHDAALAGFGTEAAAILGAGGRAAAGSVSDRVSLMLRNRWALSAGHAASAAKEIIHFWDETGIFVISNNTQCIAPRIALFAEVGDAKDAIEDASRIEDWVADRLAGGKLESLILAAGMSPTAARSLAAVAIRTGDRALAHALVQAIQEGAELPAEMREGVRKILLADARQADREGWRSWTAALRLPGDLDQADTFAVLDAYPRDYRMLGQAYRDLAERSAAELIAAPDSLLAVLSLQRLDKLTSRLPADGHGWRDWTADHLLSEVRLQIAELLIGKVEQAARIMLADPGKRTVGLHDDFLQLLTNNGYAQEVDGILRERNQELARSFEHLADYDYDQYHRLLMTIAELGRRCELTPAQATRLDELADYLETLDLNDLSSVHLVRQTDELPQILSLVAALGGFDTGILSAQASLAAERIDAEAGNRAPFFSLFDQARRRELNRWHDIDDRAAAVRLIGTLFTLGLSSACIALNALWKFPDPAIAAPILRDLLSEVDSSPKHQELVAHTLCSLRGTPEPDCWIGSDDPVLRVVLADSCHATVSRHLNPTLSTLLFDIDGSVRVEAVRRLEKIRTPGQRALLIRLAALPDPGWTCWTCRTMNPPGQSPCLTKDCHVAAPKPAEVAALLLAGEPAPQAGIHKIFIANSSDD
jgi:hypothetical protein